MEAGSKETEKVLEMIWRELRPVVVATKPGQFDFPLEISLLLRDNANFRRAVAQMLAVTVDDACRNT